MANDFLKKTDAELLKMLNDNRETLRTFRFNEAGTRSRNVKEGSLVKKEIARIMTELFRRRIANVAEIR